MGCVNLLAVRRLLLGLSCLVLVFAGAELMRHWGLSLRKVTRAPLFEKIFKPPLIRKPIGYFPRARDVILVVVEGLDPRDFDGLSPLLARRGEAYRGVLRGPAEGLSALDVLFTGVAFWDVLPRPLSSYRPLRPDNLVEAFRLVEGGGVFQVGGSALRHYATYPLRKEEYNPQRGTLKEDAGMFRRFMSDVQYRVATRRAFRLLHLTGLDDWKRAHPGKDLDESAWRPVLERGLESIFQVVRHPADMIVVVGIPRGVDGADEGVSCPFGIYGEAVEARADVSGDLSRITPTLALLLGLRCPALATSAPFVDLFRGHKVRNRLVVMEQSLSDATRILQYVAREACRLELEAERELADRAAAAAEKRDFAGAVELLTRAETRLHERFRALVPSAFRSEWGERLLPAYLFAVIGLVGILLSFIASRQRGVSLLGAVLMLAFLYTAFGHVRLSGSGWSLSTLEAGDVMPPWELALAAFLAYGVTAATMAWTRCYELDAFLGLYGVTAGMLFIPLGWFYLDAGPLLLLVQGAAGGSIPGPLAFAQVALVLAPILVVVGIACWPFARFMARRSEAHGVAQQGLVLPDGGQVDAAQELAVRARAVETARE